MAKHIDFDDCVVDADQIVAVMNVGQDGEEMTEIFLSSGDSVFTATPLPDVADAWFATVSEDPDYNEDDDSDEYD